jgi:uncharacterized SAM-binding protein YcdF (DUF218 family)
MSRHRAPLDDPDIARAAETLWVYHRLDDAWDVTADVGIGLGGHDLSVVDTAVLLYRCARFPLIVFTGANVPTTIDRFPRGEAVHFRERALELGVPAASVLSEPTATNTGENVTRTRALLADAGVVPATVTLISRPYQQRRARATCRALWPEVDVVTAGAQMGIRDYIETIGDEHRVITMLVGDTQRIEVYADRWFAAPEPVPDDVRAAFELLVRRGYTGRLV